MPVDIFDVTVAVNNDQYGKTQTMALQGPLEFAGAKEIAMEFINLRASLLGRDADVVGINYAAPQGLGTPAIELLRLRDAKQPNIGQPFQVPVANGMPSVMLSNTDNSADPLWNALSITLFAQCAGPPVKRCRYTLTLVGQPDRAVVGGIYNGLINFGGSAPTQLNSRVKLLLDYLTAVGSKWGCSGQNPAAPKCNITSFGLEAVTGRLVCSVPGGHPFASGEKVKITKTKAGKRVNKVWEVDALSDVSFALVGSSFTLPQVPVGSGKAIRTQDADGVRDVAFYKFLPPVEGAWNAPFGIRVASRKPGRRVTLASFRHKGKA